MKLLLFSMLVVTLASCNFVTQAKQEPVSVTAPGAKSSNFETNDSSYLKVKIEEGRYNIEFLKQVSVLENINSLDSFLQKNGKLIDKEKILVSGFDTTKKNPDFTAVLTKYGFSRFRVNF